MLFRCLGGASGACCCAAIVKLGRGNRANGGPVGAVRAFWLPFCNVRQTRYERGGTA